MKKYTCEKCGKPFELDHPPASCPHCGRVSKAKINPTAAKTSIEETQDEFSGDLEDIEDFDDLIVDELPNIEVEVENEDDDFVNFNLESDDPAKDEIPDNLDLEFPEIESESITFSDSNDQDSDPDFDLGPDIESAATDVAGTIRHGKTKTLADEGVQTIEHPPELRSLTGTDPLATLGSGQKEGIDSASLQTTNFDNPAMTDSALEFDLHDAITIQDETQQDSTSDKDNKNFESIYPTIQAPQPVPEGTVINPNAAKDAAEQYSDGLNTIIPPRTVSRSDDTGKLQDYKVEKRLGSGAFGVVFQAVQVPLDRSVAVKVLQVDQKAPKKRQDKLKNEFLREAQFTGRLEHPNIVPIHDIGLTINENGSANPFYVMKEIRGKSWLNSIRTNSLAANLEIFKRVTNAIGFAHDKNILHCDLKPDNVMLGEFGEVLVVDWGQAVDLSVPDTIRPGGTPAYISPEMAQYWCDVYLDRREDSPVKKLIGFRSDVYLLGALLFEIVTRKPPHLADEQASPYDTIRSAAKNEIVDYQEFADDELMQIALATLRRTDGKSIDTVQELLDAIESYENRRLSIDLRLRADQVLEEAKRDGDNDAYQRARFGYEEALEKWQGNTAAKTGLLDAQVSCAELALKDQNFDLGIGMLDTPRSDREVELKTKLVAGKTKRDRQKKLVRWLALGLGASILVGLGLNGFMIDQNLKTIKLRDEAIVEKAQADEATQLAVAAKQKIEQEVLPLRTEIQMNQQEIQKFPEKLAAEKTKFDSQLQETQKKLALNLKREQDKHSEELELEQMKLDARLKEEQQQLAVKLDEEKDKFQQQTVALVKQKEVLNEQVSSLNASSRLLRYKSRLTSVLQKLQSGDYQESRKLLAEFNEGDPWEVQRLRLLAHPEIKAIYPKQRLNSFGASQDGTRFVLVFDDHIEVRNTSDFESVLVTIPIQGASATALSTDGVKLAIAKPAESSIKPGVIWIIDLSSPSVPKEERRLNAQSQSIKRLCFSGNGQRLLSVGSPSRIRKSSGGLEEELMVWDKNWQPIDVKLIARNGSLPKFENAEFSANGQRILATNPNGISKDLIAHVFEDSGDGYQWLTESPVSGINSATFGNESGTEVIACARDPELGTYILATWNVASSTSDSAEFVNASSAPIRGSFRIVDQLDEKALSIVRSGDWVVTSGQDKKTTLWDWMTKTRKSFGGHSRDVDFCALIPGKSLEENLLISVATGDSPEILKNDLSVFNPEVSSKQMGRIGKNEQPSPTTFAYSRVTGATAFGNDLGQVAIQHNGKNIQWDVSAWKRHVLSDRYLFAQSREDYFYKFNRRTGAIEEILTALAGSANKTFRGEIVQFEVSGDGRIALVVNDDGRPEFHLWNLETQTKIRTINFGDEDVFGTGANKGLSVLRLSPNGQWVVGGKVGVFAWSTISGQRKSLTTSGPEMARSSISSIRFLDDGSKFLGSWKDRVDVFDLNGIQGHQKFNTSKIFYNKNEPSILDARLAGNQIQILARGTGSKGGIVVLDLASDQEVARFTSAVNASFSQSAPEEVIVVNKPGSANTVSIWSSSTKQLRTVAIEETLMESFGNELQTIERAVVAADGTLTLQSSTKNQSNSLHRDWNTICLNADLSMGALRVFKQPRLDYVAVAGDLVTTFDHGSIRFWKLLNNSVQPDGVLETFARTCQLSRDEKTLLYVSRDSRSIVGIDPNDKSIRFSISNSSGTSIESVAWNTDSSRFALGFKNGTVELYRVNTLQHAATVIENFNVTSKPITKVQFAEQSESLVAFASTGSAHVLHSVAGQKSRVLIRHSDGQQILTGDISSDGKRVVTGSDKGRITIWNCEAAGNVNESDDQNSNGSAERELVTLQNKHQSAVSFATFRRNKNGQSEVYSAESSAGDNRFLVWGSEARD